MVSSYTFNEPLLPVIAIFPKSFQPYIDRLRHVCGGRGAPITGDGYPHSGITFTSSTDPICWRAVLIIDYYSYS